MANLLEAFCVFFVVCGPIDNAAAFAALTKGYDPARRRRVALKSIIVAAVVMMLFTIFGDDILHHIGVAVPSLEIAGGILLLLLSIQMVMAEPSAEKDPGSGSESKDIAVFPMAMPLIAGPDAIVATVLLCSRAGATIRVQLGVIIVMLLVLFLTYVGLLAAGRLIKLLRPQGIEIASRILGLLLAAVAVEFVIDGLSKSVLFAGGT